MQVGDCWKYALETIIFPCIHDASFQIIKDASRYSSAVPLCLVKLHTELSLSFMGILNLECAVRPPGMMDAAIPDVAVATTMRSVVRTLAKSAL